MKQSECVRLILSSSMSNRDIAKHTGQSKNTVARYRAVAKRKKLTWAGVKGLDPARVRALFCEAPSGGAKRVEPCWATVHQELGHKGVTKKLLWEEYSAGLRTGAMSYPQFCAKLKSHIDRLSPRMRNAHPAGEAVLVDYSGVGMKLMDPTTRLPVAVQVFVAVCPHSAYIFAECTLSQQTPDWISSLVRTLEFFGGAPSVLVFDNLKAAVTKAGRQPVLQRVHVEFGRHYDLALVATRPRHPEDKAAVEEAVKFVQQRVIATLRKETFHTLAELNAAFAKKLEAANDRMMTDYGMSRRQRFEASERGALRPLPGTRFDYAEWLPIPKVPKDYHVNVRGHFYSVPHTLLGEKVEARLDDATVEVFHQGRCIARHARSTERGGATTVPAHQPENHRAQAGRTIEGARAWAKTIGPYTVRLVEAQFARTNPYIGLPACDGFRALAHKHGTALFEHAARTVAEQNSLTLTSVGRALASPRAQVRRIVAPSKRPPAPRVRSFPSPPPSGVASWQHHP